MISSTTGLSSAKKYLFLLSALVLCIPIYSSAQYTFQKAYGGSNDEAAYFAQQTNDGGYVVVGWSRTFETSGGNGDNVYLIKTDNKGDTTWTRSWGGISYDGGEWVQQTTDGGYIISAYAGSFGAGGGDDIYLIRTNASGDTLWTKMIGGTGYESGYKILQTTDGGFIVTGATLSFGAGMMDVYLIKTDANGDTIWTKTYGGTDYDGGYDVDQLSDGGYILSGYTASFGAGGDDLYLIRIDSLGVPAWSKTYGGSADERAYSVVPLYDGGFLVGGYTESFGVDSEDYYVVRTNSVGDTVWTRTYGGVSWDEPYSLVQMMDGNYAIGGFTQSFNDTSDGYLVKFDDNGNVLWSKTYGGIGWSGLSSVENTSDGGLILSAWTTSFGAGGEDLYLIKTNADGSSGCNESTVTTNVGTPPTIVTDAATIASATNTTNVSPPTDQQHGGIVTALCLDSCNVVVNFTGLPDTTCYDDVDIALTGIPAGGNFTGIGMAGYNFNASAAGLGPHDITYSFTDSSGCAGSYTATITVVNCDGVRDLNGSASIHILPNPSSGNFAITSDHLITGKIEIFNSIGVKMFEQTVSNSTQTQISLRNVSAGIYFVKITDGAKAYLKKVVIE